MIKHYEYDGEHFLVMPYGFTPEILLTEILSDGTQCFKIREAPYHTSEKPPLDEGGLDYKIRPVKPCPSNE